MKKHRLTLILGGLLVIAAIAALFIPLRTALVFYEENTENIEAFLPLEAGDTFQIIFTHSIHLTDVVEKYEVMDTYEIRQNEIIYEEFGIGMPSNAEKGATFSHENGRYHVKDLDNYFASMNIRNGKAVSEHRLVWNSSTDNTSENEKMVWFNEYFEPGAWFTLKVEKLSLWDYWKGVKISD
ncbi:DUF1850 domain-containing protein [Virgibacillus xinjiangensis]|uniref:DUF1850 domain-containing protein n=1 Tax=Virgibacillus xinjiangensis TaxID=393090 RepID=A0ABV7CY36_9BACI